MDGQLCKLEKESAYQHIFAGYQFTSSAHVNSAEDIQTVLGWTFFFYSLLQKIEYSSLC